MLRALRRSFLWTTFVLALSMAGLRFVAPAPAEIFGSAGGAELAPASVVERLYTLLHALANRDRFAVYGDRWVTSPSVTPPDIGRAGHGQTEMGQALSDLRSRQVGGASGPIGEQGLMDAVRTEMTRRDRDPGFGNRPAPAEPRRLIVGE